MSPAAKRRGRPAGSKNKPKPVDPAPVTLTPSQAVLALVDERLEAVRLEMRRLRTARSILVRK